VTMTFNFSYARRTNTRNLQKLYTSDITEKCARSNNNFPIECYAGAADFVLFSVIALQF